jgi:hypothetical protein
MILAVTIFNSGSYRFKTEVFAVLVNIAWTYLLHEHYGRAGGSGRSTLTAPPLL